MHWKAKEPILQRNILRAGLRAAVTLTISLCFAIPSAWAANASTKVMYFYCYGPQTKAGDPPPAKVYLSGVSSAVYTEAGDEASSNAFRQFVSGTYGADFEPRCEYSGTELAATRLLNNLANRYHEDAVKTGWTWTDPSKADPSKAPERPNEVDPIEAPED